MAVVCISRQFGAGGKTLGQALAKETRYDFVYEEMVARVAREANLSEEWIKLSEREVPGGMKSRGLLSSSTIERLLGESETAPRENQLIRFFRKTIMEIAERDNVIFLGRGCQFILPSNRNTIKILLVAPEDYRLDFMVKNYNLSSKEALDTVRDWDKNRTKFLKKLASTDPDEISRYDLVINTSLVRMAWAVEIITHLVANREVG